MYVLFINSQLRLTDEAKNKVYEVPSSAWLKMDAYQDFWREQPIKQADGRTPGKSSKIYMFTPHTVFHIRQNIKGFLLRLLY
jgi:hypothetical protein